MTRAAQGRRASLARRAAEASLVALLGASCQGGPWPPREPWSFAVTRAVWSAPPSPPRTQDGDAYAALAILLVPVALDLACLPVTLPHDLCLD